MGAAHILVQAIVTQFNRSDVRDKRQAWES